MQAQLRAPSGSYNGMCRDNHEGVWLVGKADWRKGRTP
jgi:hypothetical protein